MHSHMYSLIETHTWVPQCGMCKTVLPPTWEHPSLLRPCGRGVIQSSAFLSESSTLYDSTPQHNHMLCSRIARSKTRPRGPAPYPQMVWGCSRCSVAKDSLSHNRQCLQGRINQNSLLKRLNFLSKTGIFAKK